MKNKRTLYECSHARVTGERIRCRHGHPFSLKSEDFDGTWEPMPESERGWSMRHDATKYNKSVKKGGAANERW
jgi:hypothetical protein